MKVPRIPVLALTAVVAFLAFGGSASAGVTGTLTDQGCWGDLNGGISTPRNVCDVGELATPGIEGLGTASAQTELASTPDGSRVFVSSSEDGTVSSFARRPDGMLSYQGCIEVLPLDHGCANGASASFASPRGLAVSAGGQHLYVSTQSTPSVWRLDVGPGGELTAAGCIRDSSSGASCPTEGFGYSNPREIVVAPDGKNAYVSSDSALILFAVMPNGDLQFDSCLTRPGGTQGCVEIPGFGNPAEVEVAAGEGGDLYVLGQLTSEATANIFHIPRDGAGSLDVGGRDCQAMVFMSTSVCPVAFTSVGNIRIALSPDGRNLYTQSTAIGNVYGFNLDATGALSAAACFGAIGCPSGPPTAFPGAGTLEVDPTGDQVLVSTGDSLAYLDRRADGGLSYGGCIADAGVTTNPCRGQTAEAVAGTQDFVISPDGGSVYAVSTEDALTMLKRNLGPPRLRLNAVATQLLAQARVTALCVDSPCRFIARGMAMPRPEGDGKGGKAERFKLKTRKLDLERGEKAKIKLKFKEQAKLAKLLDAGATAKLGLKLTVRNDSGSAKKRKTIKLR